MMNVIFLFVFLFFFTSCSQKEHEIAVFKDYCHGKIARTEHNYFVIYLDYYKAEKCFIWSINKPYSVKKRGKEVRYKLLPPFRKVMYKSLKMTWAPKVFPSSKPFYLEGRDTLWLPWNRDLNIFNDPGFAEEFGFANLKSISRGDSLILDIPCVDEYYIKTNSSFQIGLSKVPVFECKIDPVDRDYPILLEPK